MFLKECGPSGDEKLIEKLSEKKEEIGVAVKIMNKLSADEIEYQKYLAREKFLMDEISKKKYAEYKMNKIKEERDDAVARKEQAEQENKKAQEEKKKAQEEKQKAQEEKQKAEKQTKKVEQMAREMLIIQLKLKFNQFSQVYEEKIMNISMNKIEEISTRILALKDVEELETYF